MPGVPTRLVHELKPGTLHVHSQVNFISHLKPFLISKLWLKVSWIQTTLSRGTLNGLMHLWVNIQCQHLIPALYVRLWAPCSHNQRSKCVDLSMGTLHLKSLLVLIGSEGSTLILPLFLLSPSIIMFCYCSITITEDHFLIIFCSTEYPLCIDVPVNIHSLIP